MSDRIEYEIQVLDKFSSNLKKFDNLIRKNDTSVRKFSANLNTINLKFDKFGKNLNISKSLREINKLERAIGKLSNLNKSFNFTKLNSGFNAMARNIANMEASLTGLAKANANIVKQQGGLASAQGQNTRGQRRQQQENLSQRKNRMPAMIGGGLGSFGGMARAMGYYELINAGVMLPRTVYGNIKEMKGLEASMSGLRKISAPDMALPEQEIKNIRAIADKYGVAFRDIADPFKNIIATGKLPAETVRKLISGGAGYSSLMGLSSPAQESLFRALEQMLSKEKIQAQEFNLQLQQAPGMKNMFYEAFLLALKKQGIDTVKGEVTPENVAAKFVEYMEKGKMEAHIILKYLSEVLLNPKREAQYIAKSREIRGEESRLKTAFQFTTTEIGRTLEPQIKDSLIGLTNAFNSTAESISKSGREIQLTLNGIAAVFKGIAKIQGVMNLGATKVAEFGFAGYEMIKNAKAREAIEKLKSGQAITEKDRQAIYGLPPSEFESVKSLLSNDINKNLLNYSTIPQKSDKEIKEQIIKVILEGKDMPANVNARVENYGANSTRMRVESNLQGGY